MAQDILKGYFKDEFPPSKYHSGLFSDAGSRTHSGGRSRWVSEFEASVNYRVSSRTGSKATKRNPVSKSKKNSNKKTEVCTFLIHHGHFFITPLFQFK